MTTGEPMTGPVGTGTTLERVSDCEIVITRTFNGPARIVFEAWTRPELVQRWWAPRSHGVSFASCDADVRPGGHYRYVLRRESGEEMAFSGRYIEVTPHVRVVYTARFEPAGEQEATNTATFEEVDGRTHLVLRSTYPSKEVLDMTLEVGMEHGMRETMEQLSELVAMLAR